MTTTLLDMQIGVQRRVLGWLPEIAARRDARAIVGMGLAAATLVNPASALAARPGGATGGATGGNVTTDDTACSSGPVERVVSFINYAMRAIIAIIGAMVLLRFVMAAWTMVVSNKPNRGKKALNDMMWVAAGFLVVILIFPFRWAIITVVNVLFQDSAGAGPTLEECATAPTGGVGS